ncbi:MAG: YcxB family protein [Oscillospiraceae bacterium]|nr:YcxB family protein [Oscillospiraceae bacterium]
MNIQFENKLFMTPAMMTEVMWNQMKVMKTLMRIALCAITGCVIYGVVVSLINGFVATNVFVPIIISSLLLYLCWRMPNSTIRGIVKELARHNGGKLPETTTVFGDKIVTTTMEQSVEYSYDRIQSVRSLNHSYLLVVGKRESLPIKRDGFTQGDFESFKAFLRTKRPDLKIPE